LLQEDTPIEEIIGKAKAHDKYPFDPNMMSTVIDTYNIMENPDYKEVIDIIHINDNDNFTYKVHDVPILRIDIAGNHKVIKVHNNL